MAQNKNTKIKTGWAIRPLTFKLVKQIAKKRKMAAQELSEELILKSLEHEK